MSTEVTVVGNLTDDPQFKYLADGTAVARFTVASNERVNNNGTWRDADPVYMPCNVWRSLAENAVESLNKGDRVMVTGRLRTNTWTTQSGEQRSRMELTVDELGPSLKFATAKPTKTRGQAAAREQAPTVQANQVQSQAHTTAGQGPGPAAFAGASFGAPAQAATAPQPQVSTGGPARSYRQPTGTRRTR